MGEPASPRHLLPERVQELLLRDLPVPRNPRRQNDQFLAETRLKAVDFMFRVTMKARLGMSATWCAVRLYDTFYATTTTESWLLHTQMIAVVCINLAAKLHSYDTLDYRDMLRYFYTNVVEDQRICGFDKFHAFYHVAELTLLNTLKFELSMPTPEEYIMEMSTWLDPLSATRNNETRPKVEVDVARMILYMIGVMLHFEECSGYTAAEMAGVVSFLVASHLNAVPQPYPVVSPQMRSFWGTIPWSVSNKLAKLFYRSVTTLMDELPNAYIGFIFQKEHDRWFACLSSRGISETQEEEEE